MRWIFARRGDGGTRGERPKPGIQCGVGDRRHFAPVPASSSPAWLGKGLDYWGLNRLGLTPRLPDIQLCVLAFRRFATTVFEDGKKCSTDNEYTEQSNDNHGIE